MTRFTRFACLFLLLRVSTASAEVDFYRDVQPILKANCLACHNKTTTESSLNLESPELIRAGGDSGPAVVLGKAQESLLYLAARHAGDTVMPPAGNTVGAKDLTPEELQVLGAWIDGGAKDSTPVVKQIHWRPLPADFHPIYSVSMTSDGRWGACGRGNLVAVYDLATRTPAGSLIDPALDNPAAPPQPARSHQGLVQALAFSPDGSRLASASFREVKIWTRAAAPAAPAKLTVPDLLCHAFTPDGRQHVTVDAQGTLQTHEIATGQLIRAIPAATSTAAVQLVLSPNGSIAAVASAEAVQLWNLESAASLGTIALTSPFQGLAWTGEASLAVAGADKIIRICKLSPAAPGEQPTVAEERQILSPTPVNFLAGIPASDRLLAADSEGQGHIWSLSDGSTLSSFKIPGGVTYAVSPNGQLLAAGGIDGKVRLWDLATNQLRAELSGDLQSLQRLGEVNWRLAVLNLELEYQNKEVTRLTAANKSLEEVIKKEQKTVETVNVVLPERQKSLADATTAQEAAQNEVKQLNDKIAQLAPDANPAELQTQLKAAEQTLMKAAEQAASAQKELKTSENHLNDAQNEIDYANSATVRNAELLKAAQAAIGVATAAMEHVKADQTAVTQAQGAQAQRVLAVCFSADSQVVATIDQRGEQRAWAIASGMPVLYRPAVGEISSATILSPGNGEFLTWTSSGQTDLLPTNAPWKLERVLGAAESPTAFSDQVTALAFSPDGSQLAVGGGEPSRFGEISLWDVESGQQLANWNDRHGDTVLSLAFSPDGTLLASGGADRLVKVTAVASGQQRNMFEGHTHHALGVSFRADGRLLASSGADGVVLVWDMQTGERSQKIAGWTKEVTAVSFLGATTQIATTGGDNRVRIVDHLGKEVRSIANVPAFQHAIAGSSDATQFLTGGEDGILRLWNTADGRELIAFPPAAAR